MSEVRNLPDCHIAQWWHDTITLNDYRREIGNERTWEQLYFRLLHGQLVQDAKRIDRFFYIYKGSTWQLILHRGLRIKGMYA